MRFLALCLTLASFIVPLPVFAAGLAEYGCIGEAEAKAASGTKAAAFRAMRDGDVHTALPLLEQAASQEPTEQMVQRCLGVALVGMAASAKDEASAKVFAARAHTAFLDAKKLGDTSEEVQRGIEITGEKFVFDDRPIATVIRDGEAAFTRGDFRTALTHYQRALQLDPKLYEAALFAGDAHLQLREWDLAGEWYAKAIAINPNRETAYRYWGDALIGAGQMETARDKFIDAIIAEPYNRTSYKGLGQWAQRYRVTLRMPRIDVPVSAKDKTLSMSQDAQPYWLGYGMERAMSKDDALQAETKALRTALQIAREMGVADSEKDPALTTLKRLDEKGLLEAHVLFHRANQAIAERYAVYRDAHRDLLRRYWMEEVIQR